MSLPRLCHFWIRYRAWSQLHQQDSSSKTKGLVHVVCLPYLQWQTRWLAKSPSKKILSVRLIVWPKMFDLLDKKSILRRNVIWLQWTILTDKAVYQFARQIICILASFIKHWHFFDIFWISLIFETKIQKIFSLETQFTHKEIKKMINKGDDKLNFTHSSIIRRRAFFL